MGENRKTLSRGLKNRKKRVSKLFNHLKYEEIVTAILILLLTPIITELYNSFFNKVEIINLSVRNVPKIINGQELNIENPKAYYSNYIENDVSVKNNKSNNIIIDEVGIKNVRVDENYQYEDVKIHYGLNKNSQMFDIYAFNNGNKASHNIKYLVKMIWRSDKKSKIIYKKIINSNKLYRGEITKILTENLISSKLIKYFNLTNNNQLLEIHIKNLKNLSQEDPIIFSFDNKTKRFGENMGGGSLLNDKPENIIIPLYKPYKKEYVRPTSQNIKKNSTTVVKFNLLAQKTSRIAYDIELKSNNKVIKPSNKKILHKTLKVRMPVYNLSDNDRGLDGKIYLYCQKNHLKNSTYEEVKLKERNLIYSVETTKKEFNIN
ncbi:hypothetical protein ACVRXF_10840 [Streptococcus orisasini]